MALRSGLSHASIVSSSVVLEAGSRYSSRVTVLEVIKRSTEFLAGKGVESPRLQAELLLAHVLKIKRLRLYLDFERELSPSDLDQMRAMVKRRGAREPLQHILGSVSFCGFEIAVSRDVLIPRPETELLAERAWTFLEERLKTGKTAVNALDLGTGSGCLSIALAAKVPEARIVAIDLSGSALAQARRNAESNGVLARIDFHEGNAFEAVPAGLKFDLIVSNPPYIPTREVASLEPEVRDYDPALALDGGVDGLDFFRLLAVEAPHRLDPEGRLMVEFGDGQEVALQAIFSPPQWRVEAIVPDYTGRNRILIARSAES
jgi:release factor glutamine methyltransferase